MKTVQNGSGYYGKGTWRLPIVIYGATNARARSSVWIERWIPVPKAGGSNPPGRAISQFCVWGLSNVLGGVVVDRQRE